MRLTNGQEIAIAPLSNEHDRKAFDCGQDSLNRYLRDFARQHGKKNIARTFVAVAPGSPLILGYYTVCAGSIAFENLPPHSVNLPHHPIPTLHLARLAVDNRCQGLGLGRTLLFEVFKLALELSEKVGIYAVDVFAIDEAARQFYLRHGFIPLQDEERHLFLPVKDLAGLEFDL